jgi:glutamate/tyrosine decarboxylase-like PLP-dependent enzyme
VTESRSLFHNTSPEAEVYDLADLTPQCGRKGEALKMFLSWSFYGKDGHARRIENAFDMAHYLYNILEVNPNFVLVSRKPLPCLQVCFYWARNGDLHAKKDNSRVTETIAQRLHPRGFMIDYAPGDQGKFFRAVVGRETRKETVEGLVKAIEQLGEELETVN